MHRFFAPALDPGDEIVVLPRDESEHLTRVLRLSTGDTVAVFDGRGREYTARVVEAHKRDARVQLIARAEPAAEAAVPITLAQSVLKLDKMDDVVRDAVMLGVSAIQPIVSTRTEFTVAGLLRADRVARWRRVALASVKQCGRAVLPDVRTPLAFPDYVNDPRPAVTLMLVEPRAAAATTTTLAGMRGAPLPPDVAVLVGPEGGWTDQERQTAEERGINLVTLGRRTLRADVAPIAALCVLQFLFGDI